MTWPILIVATLSAILVAIVCFALGVRNLAVILPAQFATSFASTWAITAAYAPAPLDDRALWTCLLGATAVPATWFVMNLIVGPLRRRRAAR